MLLADCYEPNDIISLLEKSVEVAVTPLNQLHMSDYFFTNFEGKRFQFSRKQAGELLGNIDEAEDQLRDYYNNAEYNCQIVEGIISPYRLRGVDIKSHAIERVSARDLGSSIYGYKIHPDGQMEGHSFSGVTYSMVQAWIHRLAVSGITTYFTDNFIETARLLIIIYKNEQKPPEEHTTLRRVIRPRLQIRDATPFFKSILYISHAYQLDIGEKKAKVIEAEFTNIADIATSPIERLLSCEGIGKGIATKLLRALRGEE
jgi:hypothetical protein